MKQIYLSTIKLNHTNITEYENGLCIGTPNVFKDSKFDPISWYF